MTIQISIRYKDSKGDEYMNQVEISRYELENFVDDKFLDYKFQQAKHHLLAYLKEKKIDFKN